MYFGLWNSIDLVLVHLKESPLTPGSSCRRWARRPREFRPGMWKSSPRPTAAAGVAPVVPSDLVLNPWSFRPSSRPQSKWISFVAEGRFAYPRTWCCVGQTRGPVEATLKSGTLRCRMIEARAVTSQSFLWMWAFGV